MRTSIRTYSELARLETFEERYNYLRLRSQVGQSTFGYDRYLNQVFYTSSQWRSVRNVVIQRDNGCDLGIYGRDILDKIIIHHMNPLSVEDLEDNIEDALNPDYLVCVTHNTHNAIHFGDSSLLNELPKDRTPGDTIPWR